MPDTTQVTDNTAPVTPASNEEKIEKLVTGKLRREKGRALLTLDVSKLHTYMDFLGVPRDESALRFKDAPASRDEIVSVQNHAIVPKALCSLDYKKSETGERMPGILEIDLLRHYNTPPTEKTLQELADSVKDAAIAVVTHYQPVEISISVAGKKAR